MEARGCTLECFPPYSSDLNQIEHKWVEVKSNKKKRALFH
ncbi:transposase [Candidatus Enterovibrio escicola]